MSNKEKSSFSLVVFLVLVLLAGFLIIPEGVKSATTYTYVNLVNMLTDMERLSVLPDVGEKTSEWTSRDRASAYSGGAYTNWSANNDGSGFIRTEADGGKVMAEMTGPGCIWRIWSAQANSGHVKIFLNGSGTPAVDLPFNQYFDRSQSPFNYSSLVYNAAGGLDNYVPIPYASSCKVVAYNDWGAYYHISYTTFPAGTVVPTFTRNLTSTELNALATVDSFFNNSLGSDPAGTRTGQTTTTNNYNVGSGQTVTPLDYSGQGAITGFKVKVNNLSTKQDQWAALRQLTVSIYWDSEAAPSVWAPLGDFFGTACGFNSYKSLPLGVQSDGWMYCYWYLPFSSRARIVIGNDGTVSRNVDVSLTRAPLTKAINTLARFHAKWNRGSFINGSGRWPDYKVMSTNGRGRFLGFMLHLFKSNDGVAPGSAPGDYWWGEGDEKFFVDGETTPSWFGTGSEDYFGYAWATPDYFSKAYHNQIYNEGGIHTKGNRVLSRFQISDCVPFQTSIEADIEKYYNDSYTAYGVMPYWYQASGTTDPYSAVSLTNRTNYYEAAGPRDATRIEGEDMAIISKTGGSLWPQYMSVFGSGWSNNQQMMWFQNNLSGVGVNSNAVLSFPVGSTQNYTVNAAFTKAGDYGTVQLYIDNISIGGNIDLYNGSVINTGEITLGTSYLTSGTHQLKVVITGKSGASSGYYFGLDYLKLTPASAVIVEGENMAVVSQSAGTAWVQDMSPWGASNWSGGRQMVWTGNTLNSNLVLSYPVSVGNTYSVSVGLTKAIDYGIVQLYIDNVAIGSQIDLYNNGVIPTGEIALGNMSLSAGTHQLKAVMVGKNGSSTGYLFGIDYLKLTPAAMSGVIFYQDINYGGTASPVIAKGNYSSLPGGVPNDWMSSLKVPSGWTVEVYEHGGFGGTKWTFTADTPWVGSDCNDKMSSFKIY